MILLEIAIWILRQLAIVALIACVIFWVAGKLIDIGAYMLA